MLDKRIRALKGRKAGVIGQGEFFRSAVILPLIKEQDQTAVLFEKRSAKLGHQPGEICFPGGKVEETDGGEQETAVRETCEELGIHPEQIEIVAPLDVFVSPFNMIVTPFLAYLHNYKPINFNSDEVAKVFCVPLNHFLQTQPSVQTVQLKLTLPEDYPYHLIPQGRDYPWRQGTYKQFFYCWQDEVIWGLTAYILHSFLKLLE